MDKTTNLAKNIDQYKNSYESNSVQVKCSVKKYALCLKTQRNGNILNLHHTIKEDNKIVRIVLSVACFDLRGNQMVAIDKRGNIFVLDFKSKHYWYHPKLITKPAVIVPALKQAKQYLVGTKCGSLVILNIDEPKLICVKICEHPVDVISFPGQPLDPKSLCLVQAGNAAYIIDLCTLNCIYRLEFDDLSMTLKFAFYVPFAEQIITCFSNDSLHLWSGVKLDVLRVVYPLKMRDRKLQLLNTEPHVIPTLYMEGDNSANYPTNPILDRSEGLILSYCCQNDGSVLCLTTLDNFLLLISLSTFELLHIIKLRDFLLYKIALLPKVNEGLLLGLTNQQQVVLFDYFNTEFKLMIDLGVCRNINLSRDGRMLAIAKCSGEMSIWMVSHLVQVLRNQERCMQLLRSGFKQSNKPINLLATSTAETECRFQQELKKLLTPQRLQKILQEYHCYPAKYRALIWSSLLQLPNNKCQYQDLLHMGVPAIINEKAQQWQLKNNNLKRNLMKCWSNLAQWCKMFAYEKSVPYLIFPFVKMFQCNALVAFEVCATLIFNQFQLFFEYHPIQPSNYLGLCSNILKHFDPSLYAFYEEKNISVNIYAWSLLKSSFAEILDQHQWLCLWDNIISAPPYYPIFCVVAYNIMQREVIRRLPNSDIMQQFFIEQNPLDVKKLISKAFKLMACCPASIHPKRYISNFRPLPKGVYPKFLNYPLKCLQKFEEKVLTLQELNAELDKKMYDLEVQDKQIMLNLEKGLRREEHSKRLKEIENHYQNTLRQEVERVNCQRKLLLMYQKTIRNRKGEVLNALQESQKRKSLMQKERELDKLQHSVETERTRNYVDLMWAEEELRNQEVELLTQKALMRSSREEQQPLIKKFNEDLQRLYREQQLLESDLKKLAAVNKDDTKKPPSVTSQYLDMVECKLKRYQKEFNSLRQPAHQ